MEREHGKFMGMANGKCENIRVYSLLIQKNRKRANEKHMGGLMV